MQLFVIMMQTYSLQWNIWVELPKLDQIIAILGQREIPKLRVKKYQDWTKKLCTRIQRIGIRNMVASPLNEGLYQVLMQG